MFSVDIEIDSTGIDIGGTFYLQVVCLTLAAAIGSFTTPA